MPTERDPTQVVDELVGAIRNLASDQNYKIVADVVSEALILKETNARLQSSHREVLEEYRKFRNELEVTETKLVTEKATLQAAIEKKDAKLEKLTARNTKLGDEVEKAKKRLDEESKKWVELVEVKNNLDKQVGALKSTLDDTSKVLGDLKAAKTNVDGELTEAKKSLAKRNTELASLEAAKSEVATLLHSTKASLDEKTKLAEELALTKEVLITELAGTTAKLNGKSKELDQLAKTKAALDTQLANVNMRLDKKIKELDGFSEAKASLEADLAHANTGLDVKSKEAEELSSLLADVGSKLDEKSKGLAETVRAKNELEAQLAEVDTQLDSEQVAKRILEEELVGIKFCLAQEIERANSLANEAAGLQQTVKDRNVEIIRLKGDVTGSKDLVEKANGAIKELETDVENLHQELQVKGARLNEIQGYQAQLKNDPEDHYVDILDKIWVSILDLTEKHFGADLEDSILQDPSCWTNLRSSEYLKHAVRIPLPQSNSPSAKQMRIAAVLAVLSRALTKHIFRPTYLIENDSELSQILRSLEAANPAHELHLRSTLLAVLPEREKRNATKRVKAVVREVSYVVQHLLSALQYESFCIALEQSCELACSHWRQIQMATMKIEPYFGPPYDDFDWQVLLLPERFNGGPSSNSANGSVISFKSHHRHGDSGYGGGDRDDVSVVAESVITTVDPVDIMLVLWPSMCAIEGGELVSITQGLVMAKDQALVALEEEGRKRPGQKRAKTMSVSKGAGVGGTLSPKSVGSSGGSAKSVKSVKSFLASVKSGIESHGLNGTQNNSAVVN